MSQEGPEKGRKALGRGLEALFGPEETADETASQQADDGPCDRKKDQKQGLSGSAAMTFGILILIMGGALEALLSHLHFSEPKKAEANGVLFAGGSQGGAGSQESPKPSSKTPPPGSAHAPVPASLPQLPDPEDYHKEAMKETVHEHFPTTPDDIKLIKDSLKKTQKAIHGPVPSGRSVSVDVSLDPGSTFPTVHLVPGIATVINVVDQTGKPWPISDVIVGNAKGFTVKTLSNGNSVVVEPRNSVGWTSLSFTLVGQDTPAVLKLVDSDRLSDTRVVARIEALGPNAAIPVFAERSPVVSRAILDFLDGLPPPAALKVRVKGTDDMEAWLYRNDLFVRTHMDVLAPAWLETISGNNGMHLYVFRPTPVITATSSDGTMSTVEVEMDGGANVEKD
jgi:intracellular multiplication protein IcmK